MPSFAYAVQSPLAVTDAFERTSSLTLDAAQKKLTEAISRSTGESEYLTRFNMFIEISRSLQELGLLSDDWNTYGSQAPSPESIENAQRILKSIRIENLLPSRVLPSAEGGVAFVFLSASANRAAIEILNNGEMYVLLYDRAGNSKTLDWTMSPSRQMELLKKLRDHLRGKSLAAS